MSHQNPELWTAALGRHANSAAAFCKSANGIDAAAWTMPVAQGKWSPAQVTEHLNQTYRVIISELISGKGLRIRTPWLLRLVLRQTILKSILRKRALPKGARAPKEVVPNEVVGTQAEVVAGFSQLAREFEDAMNNNRHNPDRKLTHHIFGEIDLLRGIDFVAIHIEHHHRQIAKATNE